MSTLALGMFRREEHALGRSFLLSAIVHIALVLVLVLGVRWQTRAPDTVTVDLVDALPPPPAPVVEPKPVPSIASCRSSTTSSGRSPAATCAVSERTIRSRPRRSSTKRM